jgi:hypothetical protein
MMILSFLDRHFEAIIILIVLCVAIKYKPWR